MAAEMNRVLLAVAVVFGTSSLLLVDSAIRGGVILTLAAFVAILLRRDSAATRHLVWLVAIVAMLVVPVFSATLPQWQVLPAGAAISRESRALKLPAPVDEMLPQSHVPLPSKVSPVEGIRPSAISDQPPVAGAVSQFEVIAPDVSAEVTREPIAPRWNWINALPLLWGVGFSLLILRLMAARALLWSIERRGTVIARSGNPNDGHTANLSESDGAIIAAFEDAHRQLGIRQRVLLIIHAERAIPVIWGISRFRLLLPDVARQWSGELLRSVLLHELAHIKRRDTVVQLLTQFACALHWFNPLVWFAAWRLHVERERACDDFVLAHGVRASAYAQHLLNVATELSPARWTAACGLAMASNSPLERRLHAILSDRLNRRRVSATVGAIALILGASIAIPIAMLRAADEPWNPPSATHVGGNDFSAYCVHVGKDAAFVIAYHGDFDSTSRSSSNSKARTWTDSVTLTAKQPGIALTFHRTHIAPDKLSIKTAPAEAQDLSNPAPPPREFGQKEHDLAKGRVFLLSDNGSIRQLDIATPLVRDNESAMKLAALIAAIPPQERNDSAFITNFTVQLAPETVAKLKWGEPVNGLRMALAWPPIFDDAALGKKPYFQLVVQNVSEKEIHFLASDDAPNPRELNFRADNRTVLVLADEDTAKAEWHLQPGHCGVLRMFTKEERDDDGKTVSAGIEGDLSKIDRNHAVAEMEIAKAPAGAWTGKLITGKTRGSADKAAAPAPMHKAARAHYEVWQRYARANGDIPGALVGELAAAVKQFIKYNPTWKTVPKLNEVLPRLDATHDWKPADAIALLDEMAGIQHTLLEQAPWKGTRQTIRHGDALPKKYADVPWGEEQPSGLRAAWVLEPGGAEHRIGAALRARLLVQNRGQVAVMLQVPTWHQGWVKASDANGKEVEASGLEWTTLAQLFPCRLAPGEYIEINTPGVGFGPRAGMGPWAGPRVGSNVLAKAGDELTLTHSLVPLDGSEVGVSEDDPHVSGPGWWLAHIKTRLNRELPLPTDAAERTRLLDRAVRELFATAPTAEETEAFIADKTPDALDALAKRLATRVDVVSFSGKLPTAPVKFRVLDAAADADKQPRVVLGPGEYPLSAGTANSGAAKLKIVGKPVGDRRTNDAQILFEATEATGKLPPDPHQLEVPDGWGTWAIVCRPGSGVFYLLSKGAVRKIDFSYPAKVTDTPANDLPAEFRDEVKRQLDIHGISDAQQAEILEKPAAPAAVPDSTTNADVPAKPAGAIKLVKLTPDALLGFWRGKMDDKDLMLSFHRPPVEKDVQLDIYEGKATIGALAKFTISPDGGSALVTSNRADSAAFGTLHSIDANTMRLERVDGEGKAAIFVILTRDAEAAATEPRQAEAREIFDMWKRTANADGTIPGTFIGQLAAEVRIYVRANPTLDSAAKLPKLLPRFVTSRDWTQAEAIKLLDDVAYYATEPIAARVAKAKLPNAGQRKRRRQAQRITHRSSTVPVFASRNGRTTVGRSYVNPRAC
jgi:beta-lactamase regulating signal transducer with metallopeptidase domain